jgi:regulation of enolase protein 1 (concanavalin A-like superfamily)
MQIDFTKGIWLNRPRIFKVSDTRVEIQTEPDTDLWQRTYYGFRNDNAPALLLKSQADFTFTLRVSFVYKSRYDQCGVTIYSDNNNWFKASVEHEDLKVARLGSVVTNNGYSDWATVDIAPTQMMWFRLHRRGPDFLIESASDAKSFKQMRIFHMHFLDRKSADSSKGTAIDQGADPIQFGLYACSPQDSSFRAIFDCCELRNCQWKAHHG